MMGIFILYEQVNPQTGKTFKQENLEIQHNIPIGALVEVKFDQWYGDGACMKVHARLWVVAHTRDCDGTPLYSLSRWNDSEFAKGHGPTFHDFDEESLTVIPLTENVVKGNDVLEWEETEE